MAVVGIDLGTTFSLVARLERGRPRLLAVDGESTLLPSVVAFPAETAVPLVGRAALERGRPSETIFSAKRFLAKGLHDIGAFERKLPFDLSPSDERSIRFRVGERTVTPIEVSARVLRHLKDAAEKAAGESVTAAVITVPAYFDDNQRQATKKAAELAGLEVWRLVNEPTAACLAYGLDRKPSGVIAVFDLGGGTFDLSILRVADGVFEVLATAGDTQLGGDDFDLVLVDAVRARAADAWGGWIDTAAGKTALKREAERLKRLLSTGEAGEFRVEYGGRTLAQTFTRADFEKLAAPLLERIRHVCTASLADTGLKAEAVTDVLLVGGSSRMPVAKHLARSIFGRVPIDTLNPDEVVAIGAAVQASILAGQNQELLLLDVLPLSLGIEAVGGVTEKILHRNSKIPISASQTFSTSVDGQTNVAIAIVQGERELARDNRPLARFELRGLPPMPAGVPKIEVEFVIDANGILSVRATELRTRTAAAVVVNPTFGLEDADVEQMLQQSFDFAESDMEQRFLIQERTEAQAILLATAKSLRAGRALIPPAEVAQIERTAVALEGVLGANDRQALRTRREALEAATKNLAEQVLNHAVGAALRDHRLE